MLVGYCITIALMVLYGFLCWRDNKKKDIQEAAWREETHGEQQDVAEEWKDLTDKRVTSSETTLVNATNCPESQVPLHLLGGRHDRGWARDVAGVWDWRRC
jgi:hypothetical protein